VISQSHVQLGSLSSGSTSRIETCKGNDSMIFSTPRIYITLIHSSQNYIRPKVPHGSVVVKSSSQLDIGANAANALAAHDTLGTNLAVETEAADRVVDQVDDVRAAHVTHGRGVSGVDSECARAVLHKLVLAIAAVTDGSGTAA
jgi:hypothetical protein